MLFQLNVGHKDATVALLEMLFTTTSKINWGGGGGGVRACHEIVGPLECTDPPVQIFRKYLDRVRSACCSRVVNCTNTRFVRSWDDTLLTRCHEPSLLPIRDEETSFQNVEGEETYNVSSVKKKRSVRVTEGNPILVQ